MNWAAVTGKTGRCRITKRTYKDKTGRPRNQRSGRVPRPAGCAVHAAGGWLYAGEHSNMELRPSARRVKRSRTAGGRGNDSTLLLSHRLRKDCHFAKIAEDRVRQGDRVLILAHRGELLDQAADKLHTATRTFLLTESRAELSGQLAACAVGSVQTPCAQAPGGVPRGITSAPSSSTKRITRYPDSYGRILNHFDSAKVLGVTATPRPRRYAKPRQRVSVAGLRVFADKRPSARATLCPSRR